jgi:hypothetical protein
MNYAIKLGQQGLKEANPGFTFSNNTFDRKFDKTLFKGFHASLTIEDMRANYDVYIANFNDYNLNLTISYKDEKQKEELYKILQTMKIQ